MRFTHIIHYIFYYSFELNEKQKMRKKNYFKEFVYPYTKKNLHEKDKKTSTSHFICLPICTFIYFSEQKCTCMFSCILKKAKRYDTID